MFNPDIHHRRSIRLKSFDYSSAGAYFVTICAQQRECLFGEIQEGQMKLNPAGKMIYQIWQQLSEYYPSVDLDVFVVMPNHFHGIIVLDVGAGPRACPSLGFSSKGHPEGGAPALSLADVIQRFKSLTTTRYRYGVSQDEWPPFPGRLWQRNYFERVIRNENELIDTRGYVSENPIKWELDENNPTNQELNL